MPVTQLQMLVARNVNVNEADYDGRTALHVAASEGQAQAVEYLLQVGASAQAKDRFGNTALDDARGTSKTAVVALLETHAKRKNPLKPSAFASFRSIPLLGRALPATVTAADVAGILRASGLSPEHDLRISVAFAALPATVTEADFVRFMAVHSVLPRAFEGRLAVPNLGELHADLRSAFTAVKGITAGAVPAFPPDLATADRSEFALAACTVDGQTSTHGTSAATHCIYSLSKVITYLLALEEHGLDKVHERVGREPSGRNMNDLILDHRKLPYNPLVNSGAILCTALIRAALPLAEVPFLWRTHRVLAVPVDPR